MTNMSGSDMKTYVEYDILLQHIIGIGNGRINAILEYFKSSEGFCKADTESIRASGLLTEKQLERFKKTKFSVAEKILSLCRKENISVLGISDSAYPQRLRNIPDPPAVLYYKGILPEIDALPLFCIVGPREISPFGEKASYALARRLSLAGMTVVGGIARGGDSAAHEGAMSVGKAGIAVLPSGHKHDYLLETRPMRDKLLREGGCIISECPPEMKITRNSFHIRNRILSGLALGTAVIEAGERSGALITARHAAEQGRDVFVIPGNPTLPQYKGSNRLIADGAKPLLDAKSILLEYTAQFGDAIDIDRAFAKRENNENKKTFQKKSCETLSKEAKIVYNSLDKPKFMLDELVATGLSDDELLFAITELEMNGLAEQLPGGFYTLK